MGTELALEDDNVINEGNRFIKLFYDIMDRRRERVDSLYCDAVPVLVWNGNPFEGKDNINKFVSQLPSSQHYIVSVDAQKIPQALSDLNEALILHVAGQVQMGLVKHGFTQTLTLVREDGKFLIKSDRFRYID